MHAHEYEHIRTHAHEYVHEYEWQCDARPQRGLHNVLRRLINIICKMTGSYVHITILAIHWTAAEHAYFVVAAQQHCVRVLQVSGWVGRGAHHCFGKLVGEANNSVVKLCFSSQALRPGLVSAIIM